MRRRRAILWRRYWKPTVAYVAGIVALILLIGSARVSALTSSERVDAAATDGEDIAGTTDLFDAADIHEISVHFDEDEYEHMIDTFTSEGEKEWIKADITIDGTVIADVGVRLKGNSTLGGAAFGGPAGDRPAGVPDGADGGRGGDNAPAEPGGGAGFTRGVDVTSAAPEDLPWLISFDEYTDGQTYQGIDRLAVRPETAMGRASESGLREATALQAIAMAGEPAEDLAYSEFSINGSPASTRLIVEEPGERFAEQNFGSDGVLYKSLSTGSFADVGDDPLDYEDSFRQITRNNQQDLQPLIDLIDWVTNASDEEFANDLDDHVDVASLANYIALHELVDNFDDMSGPGQNYYLWYDLDTERFTVVTWDLNFAFAGDQQFGQGRALQGGDGDARDGEAPSDTPSAQGAAPPQLPEGMELPEGMVPPDGGGGGRMGGNLLKERFLNNATFNAMVDDAYAALYERIYTSGAATDALQSYVDLLADSGTTDQDAVAADAEQIRSTIAEMPATRS
jgi:spore coat protein CotH